MCLMRRTPYPFGQHLLCLAPLLALLAGLWLFLGSETEIRTFFTAYRLAHPRVTFGVVVFTYLGCPLFYPVYLYILWKGVKFQKPENTRFVLAWLLGQVLVSFLLVRVLKISIGRPRPLFPEPFTPFTFDHAHHSFPSGHTSEAMGSSLPLAQRYRHFALSLFLGIMTAAIGFSRVYLSEHHPTDLLGGLVTGSLAGYLAWRFSHWPLYWWRRRGKAWKTPPWRGV